MDKGGSLLDHPTYSIVRTMEWDGLPDCVRYWCGQGGSPLDNPMYSTVRTMEWDGLYWCGQGVVHWTIPRTP